MMKRINACQPIIHARYGLQNAYLSEDWFDRIDHVIGLAKSNNMKVWLYDENNWPSGNCSWTITKNEDSREHFLQITVTALKGGELFSLDTRKKNYLNITAYDVSEEVGKNLLAVAGPDGRLEYRANADTEIYAVNLTVNEYEPFGKFCVDYLSRKQIRAFIESTHERYYQHFKEEFGKTVKGIFMDETRFFNALPWTESMSTEFKARKGYDIVPLLPLLLRDSEKSRFVRYDYYDVISDLEREATFKQIYDWCDARGILTTGHFLGEETLASQSRFNGDIMRLYRDFHIPGIDHLGNGIGSLDAKICSSAAHNYGKNLVSCESFGASGWDMTFEQIVKIANWLFSQGINMLIIHGFYYSIRDERKDDFPPSYFYQWKHWDKMPIFTDMVARMSYMLSGGVYESDILVYYPIETFWNYFKPCFDIDTCYWKKGPFIKDEKAEYIDHQFQVLCSQMLNRNLDFDFFNSDAVCNFTVKNDMLVNCLTGARYKILILPYVEMLPEPVVYLLNEFTEHGGKVISLLSDVRYISGKNGEHFKKSIKQVLNTKPFIEAKKIAHVIDVCRSLIQLPFEILSGTDEVSRTQMSYPNRLHDPYIHDGEQQYGISVTRYIKEKQRIFDFTNFNDKQERLVVSVESTCVPEIYNPETGDIEEIAHFRTDGLQYEFALSLPANRALLVVCGV